MKGEPGQKGDRGPLGLPVSKENFPFQCKSPDFFSFLPKVPALVCSVAVSQLRVLSVEHMVMSEQSTAQFCFPRCLDLVPEGHRNKRCITRFNYIHANLALVGLMDKSCHHLSLKSDIYCFITCPKHGLIEVKTLSPLLGSAWILKAVAPPVGGRYAIGHC